MSQSRHPPEIVAHRGNAAEFPENTLPALESAVELGARYVEFDVQLTADHVPVLLHDADLRRVGDRPECVHDLTWAELRDMAVGESRRFGRQFESTRPSSLSQLVDALARWDGVTAFVEVKRASLRRFGPETVLGRIAEVLRPALHRCVLISFDLASVRRLRAMTGARIGWVLPAYDDAACAEAAAAAPEFLFVDLERLPGEPEPLWPGPWDWAVYEVRDLGTALACRSRGARYVETMAVRKLIAACSGSDRRW